MNMMRRQFFRLALLALPLALASCKKKGGDKAEPCTQEDRRCTGAVLQECDANVWVDKQDCAAESGGLICKDSTTNTGEARCVTGVVVPERGLCGDEKGNCGFGVDCIADVSGKSHCFRGCTAADTSACETDEYCEENPTFLTSGACMKKGGAEAVCFSDGGCDAGLECQPRNGDSLRCTQVCAQDKLGLVGSAAGCTVGLTCSAEGPFQLQGEPATLAQATTCVPATPTACTAGYECMRLVNGTTTGDFCARRGPRCVKLNPTTLDVRTSSSSVLTDSICGTGLNFCAPLQDSGATAEPQCLGIGLASVVRLPATTCDECESLGGVCDQVGCSFPCETNFDCAVWGGQCINFRDGPQICAFFSDICVAACEDDSVCPSGTICRAPGTGEYSLGTPEIQGGLVNCSADNAICEDSACVGTAEVRACAQLCTLGSNSGCISGYTCQSLLGNSVCARARRVCLVPTPGCTEDAECHALDKEARCVGAAGAKECRCTGNFTGVGCVDCVKGFAGTDCNTPCPGPAASICNDNGTCNDGVNGDGECGCDIGWDGSACDICAPGFADPSTGCTTCKPGFYGADCTECSACAGNTVCDDGRMGTGACVCATGFADDGSGGTCNACATGYKSSAAGGPATCDECDAGYFGAGGDTCTACAGLGTAMVCGGINGASCEDGKAGKGCTCSAGYFGVACENKCPGFETAGGTCSGNGTCNDANTFGSAADGICACGAGFDGDNCELCVSGFFGSTCQPCPATTGASVCSARGTCDDGIGGGGACTCTTDTGWTADDGCATCGVNWVQSGACDTCNTGQGGTSCAVALSALCISYCNAVLRPVVQTNCDASQYFSGDRIACEDACKTAEDGGKNMECRSSHALLITDAETAAVHCPHATIASDGTCDP